MTVADPFASAPDEAQPATETAAVPSPFDNPPAEAPKEAPITTTTKTQAAPTGEGKVVLTFKGGTGFDAPWIVIHAEDLQDAFDQVNGENASLLAKTMEKVQSAGKHFASLGGGGGQQSGGGNGGGGQQRPQYQEAPNGEKRFCSHGEMSFKSGVSKAGKPYKGFFCPSRDRNDQCKAQFLN